MIKMHGETVKFKRFRSSGMLRRIDSQIVTEVEKRHSTFYFRLNQYCGGVVVSSSSSSSNSSSSSSSSSSTAESEMNSSTIYFLVI